MAPDWLTCTQTKTALAHLDSVIQAAIDTPNPALREMSLHLILRGGKRVRPALLLVAARFGEDDNSPILRAAAAMELLHIASLYHDDVVDRASLRRGGSTANSQWGNRVAAVAGTYLFARACAIIGSLDDNVNETTSTAITRLCTGQLQEIENAYNLDLTESDHLNILAGKTATLFELPCWLGAYLSRTATEYRDALTDFGRHLGMAFQLTDDLLDLIGTRDQMGKTVGIDLREGIYSLSILRAAHQSPDNREQLSKILHKTHIQTEDVQTVIALIRHSGAIEQVRALAHDYAAQAKNILDSLPDGESRRSLLQLAEFVISRDR
jgi:heptaprenyl diphosphate synthase